MMAWPMRTRLELGTAAGRPQVGQAEFTARYRTWQAADDVNAAGPDVWALDGLTLDWRMEEWPGQPDPVTAKFRVLAADPAALPPIDVGTLVHAVVDVFPQAQPWPAEWTADEPPAGTGVRVGHFWGRLSDATARTVQVPLADGGARAMLEVEVIAVSHDAEWAETWIGAQPFPADGAGGRLNLLLTESGLPSTFTWTDDVEAGDAWMDSLDVDHRTFTDVMETHLRQLGATNPGSYQTGRPGWSRAITYPRISAGRPGEWPAGDVMVEFAALTERYRGHPTALPRVMTMIDGRLTTVAKHDVAYPDGQVVPLRGTASVSAAYAAAEVVWKRDKARLPNRVVITYAGDSPPPNDGFYDFWPDAYRKRVVVDHPHLVAEQGPVTHKDEAGLGYVADAENMARLYLPDEAAFRGRWGVESVRVYPDAIPTETDLRALLEVPALFPHHGPEITGAPEDYHPFGAMLHVWGLQAGHRLAGESYVAGTITGARLEVLASAPPGRRMVLDVSLTSTARRPNWANQVVDYWPTWVAAPDTTRDYYPTVTTAQLDPTLTPYDMRLVRIERT